MTETEQSDIFERLWWALRRYVWVLAVVIAAALAAGLFVATATASEGRYRATALVVANSLNVPPSQVPRFAAAVFSSGAVAERVATELRLDIDHRDLVPDHIAMDPVPDSIAFLVHGFSDDPQDAVSLANAAADRFVEELNRAGPGVGVFAVQDVARAPLQRVEGPGFAIALAASGVGGALLAVVVVAGLVWLRRPLVTPGDAVAALGLPLLGTASVRREGLRPGAARTLASHPLIVHNLAVRLLSTPHDGFVLLGAARSKEARYALEGALEHELHQLRGAPVRVPDATGSWAPGQAAPGQSHVVLMEDLVAGRARAASWGVIVVLEQGTPARALSRLVDEWRSGDIVGVVVLRGPSHPELPGL